MDKINPLFAVTATAIGGRSGHTKTGDGAIRADLSLLRNWAVRASRAWPRRNICSRRATRPALGALDFVAKQRKRDATKAKITRTVTIGQREGGGFGIAVKMRVEDRSIVQAELDAFVRHAHEKICPYSHANRGNMEVAFDVIGAVPAISA
jgi:lipoyl-dependent peroxiredoxin